MLCLSLSTGSMYVSMATLDVLFGGLIKRCRICGTISLVTGEGCLVNQMGMLSLPELWTGTKDRKSRKWGRMKKSDA